MRLDQISLAVVAGLLMSVGGSVRSHPNAVAAQFADGRTQFDRPPQLVDFVATQDTASRGNVTYYVTVELLPETGEPLKTLTVRLVEGRFPQLNFRTEETATYLGERGDRDRPIALDSATFDADSQTLTLELQEAIAPGQVVTFALRPNRNPSFEGVYLFAVAAAPAGDTPVVQQIGIGRLNIFRPDNYELFP